MASLYSQYIKERSNDLILETEYGYATYRYIGDKAVYIVDIFVPKELRRDGHASLIADRIVKEAKEKGCVKLYGSVVPSTNNSTLSLMVLLGYGMSLESSANDFIVFSKEI